MKDMVLVYTVNNKGYHYALSEALKNKIYSFLCEIVDEFEGHPYVDIEETEGLPEITGIRSFAFQLLKDIQKSE